MLVGTTVELTILLFEVPTGVVADAYSRRLSLIVGYFIMGWGFIIEGLFPAFLPIVLAQVFWGVGYTFTSGAQQAWLSDEIGEENASRTFLRANKYDLAGAFVGMLLAIPLGNIAVNIPIVAGGVLISSIALVLGLLFGLISMPCAGPVLAALIVVTSLYGLAFGVMLLVARPPSAASASDAR